MTSAAAANYARAIADIAFEGGKADETARELDVFGGMLRESHDLTDALENPAIPFSAKRRIIEALAPKAGLSRIVVNLVLVLLQNARIGQFDAVVEAYGKESDRRRGVLRAEIYSKRELGTGVRDRLEKGLTAHFGTQVRCEYHIDEAVIAGLRVRVGSTVYDSTVQARLGAMRRRLASH